MQLTGVFLIGLAMAVLGITGCQDDASSRPVTDPRDVIVRELAAKHGAITGWEENLTYTLQAQERLVTGQPFLFRGSVDDVFLRHGKTFVRFSSFVPGYFVLELECSRSIVDSILTQTSDSFFDEWAVVGKIQDVSKPVVTLQASALSEEGAEIDIGAPELFIARGTCIDIAYIPYPR
jgi:hypothetical protein